MIGREFDSLTFADVEALVVNEVREGRRLEFKRDVPGRTDDEIKEFLADVSALANAHGGDLIFGVNDENGIAESIPGLDSKLAEGAILAIENRLRDNLEPRLRGVRIAWLGRNDERGVIIVRVPSSLSAPHRITFKNWGRFFTRGNMGKSEMDTHELRLAFNAAEGMIEGFHSLHVAAQKRALGNEMPVALSPAPYAVATITPQSFLRESSELAVTRENALAPYRAPDIAGHFQALPMLEGMLLHEFLRDGWVSSYALTHWKGRTESAWNVGMLKPGRGVDMVPVALPAIFERGLRDAVRSSIARLTAFQIAGPWILQASIHRIDGHRLVQGNFFRSDPAWRASADLAQLTIERADDQSLMPIAQAFWLAFGAERPHDLAIGG